MKIINKKLQFSTQGNCDIVDITDDIQEKIYEARLQNGFVNLFVPGATGALTTIEYEPGLIKDFKNLWEKLISERGSYFHDHGFNSNAHSHLRASVIGPSLTVPFEKGKLTLGVWQQIVFVDFDNRKRRREIILQIVGE